MMQSTAFQGQASAPSATRPQKGSLLGALRSSKLVRTSIRRSLALAFGCNMLCAFIIAATLMVQSTSALPVLFGHISFVAHESMQAHHALLDRHSDQPYLLHHYGNLDSEEHCGEFDRVASGSPGHFFADRASTDNHAHSMRRISAHHRSRASAKPAGRVCKNVNEPRALTDGPQSLPHWTQPHPSMHSEEHSLRLDALRETEVLYARPAAGWHDEL